MTGSSLSCDHSPGQTSASMTHIEVEGVRVHNLKNIALRIPHGTLTVICGVSGSGKSSLAFDTLYAEGQRRYVATFSPYARQFLNQLERPDVDRIEGIPPAIAIRQQTRLSSPLSTVGTQTDLLTLLQRLFAQAGRPYCPHGLLRLLRPKLSDQLLILLSLWRLKLQQRESPRVLPATSSCSPDSHAAFTTDVFCVWRRSPGKVSPLIP